jgi:dipeptidyl aminopeptidase/acylaminoacyl peptidase
MPDGQVSVLTAGAGVEAEPAVAPDGSIAHVSNRSGYYELWLLAPGKEPFRLTNIQGSDIIGPSWSADATRIAFIAVSGRRAEVFTVSRDGSRLRQLTDDGMAKRDVVFSGSDNRLLYLARINGRWKLMEISDDRSAPPRQVPGDEDWLTLRPAPDGSVLGQREGEEQILRVRVHSGAAGTAAITQVEAVDSIQVRETDVWGVGIQGIYVRRRSRVQPSSIWFFPWHQEGRKLAEVPLAYGPISVDPAGGVIFTQATTANIDLAMMELRAER